MIKGCIGFSYISGRLFGDMLLVRGKRVLHIPLPYPVYLLMIRLWRSKKYPGKFLFNKPNWATELEKAKSLSL